VGIRRPSRHAEDSGSEVKPVPGLVLATVARAGAREMDTKKAHTRAATVSLRTQNRLTNIDVVPRLRAPLESVRWALCNCSRLVCYWLFVTDSLRWN
jgi:hypothetical protein